MPSRQLATSGLLAALLLGISAPVPADRDGAIATRVLAALSATAAAGTIEVRVQNGAVELRGEVRSAEVRLEAERVASEVRGVTELRNSLTVSAAEPGQDADQQTALRVRRALQAAGIGGAQGFDIKVFNGEVDLSGATRSAADRVAAARIAGETRGVTAVRNSLTAP